MDYRILIVDSDAEAVEAMRAPLADLGYDVFAADDAAGARELFEAQKPNLVMIEPDLPDGSGMDLCRDLKATDAGADVPMVLFGGLEIAEQAATMPLGECGWDQLIDKNIDPEQFVVVCRELLGDTKARTDAERDAAIVEAGEALNEAAPPPDPEPEALSPDLDLHADPPTDVDRPAMVDEPDLTETEALLPQQDVDTAVGSFDSLIDDGDPAEAEALANGGARGDFSHVLKEIAKEPTAARAIDLPPQPDEFADVNDDAIDDEPTGLEPVEEPMADDAGQDIDSHLESLFGEAPADAAGPAETAEPAEAAGFSDAREPTPTTPAAMPPAAPIAESTPAPAATATATDAGAAASEISAPVAAAPTTAWKPTPKITFPDEPRRSGGSGPWIAAAAVVVLLLGGGAFFLLGGSDGDGDGEAATAAAGSVPQLFPDAPAPLPRGEFPDDPDALTAKPEVVAAVTPRPEAPEPVVPTPVPEPERKPEPETKPETKPEPEAPKPKPVEPRPQPVTPKPVETAPVAVAAAPTPRPEEPAWQVETIADPVPEPEPDLEPEPVETPPVPYEPAVETPERTIVPAEPEPYVPVVTEPVLIHRVEPELPARALKRGETETVVLRLLVNERGAISRIQVRDGARGTEPEAAAISAVLRWRYEPATEDGTPIRAWTEARFEFGR